MVKPDFQELGRIKFFGGFRKEIWKRAMCIAYQNRPIVQVYFCPM